MYVISICNCFKPRNAFSSLKCILFSFLRGESTRHAGPDETCMSSVSMTNFPRDAFSSLECILFCKMYSLLFSRDERISHTGADEICMSSVFEIVFKPPYVVDALTPDTPVIVNITQF